MEEEARKGERREIKRRWAKRIEAGLEAVWGWRLAMLSFEVDRGRGEWAM